MKVKPELANVLRQASQEVSSWEPWQRSRDPHGCVARSLPVSQETETAQRVTWTIAFQQSLQETATNLIVRMTLTG